MIDYEGLRDAQSLRSDALIASLDRSVADRVIGSMLEPSQDSIRLYNAAYGKSTVEDIADLVFTLNDRLGEVCDRDNMAIVSVLRSGHFLAEMVRHLIQRMYGRDIEIVCVSPNYIDNVDDGFREYINFPEREIVFIDGWISRAVTYGILKGFWQKQKNGKEFRMAVLSDVSLSGDFDIVSASYRDILIPWSICQTDNCGVSNFFPHPKDNKPAAFFIPQKQRLVRSFLGECKSAIDERAGYIGERNEYHVTIKKRKRPSYGRCQKERSVKVGINECIKAIDKGDAEEVHISRRMERHLAGILEEYARIHKVSVRYTDEELSYVRKSYSQ